MASFDQVYERALDLLELRDHSKRELEDKLIVKFGYDNRELAKSVCDKLAESGLLDDERFARTYADELVRRKHVSPTGLRAALSSRGIDKRISDIIIDELEIDQIEQINCLLDGKFRGRNLLDEKQCSKTMNALYRLGFSMNDIRNAILRRQEQLEAELLENS